MTMTMTPSLIIFGTFAVGAMLFTLWHAVSFVILVVRNWRNPPLEPPEPITVMNDPDYDPREWIHNVPDDPDDRTARLKYLTRNVFSGLEALDAFCDFTPEMAHDLGMSFEHLRLLETLIRLYRIRLPREDDSNTEARMMRLVNTALDSAQSETRDWNADTPAAFAEIYDEFDEDITDLGYLFFMVATDACQEGFDLGNTPLHHIKLALCFLWNFLAEWADIMRGGDTYRALQASDLVAFGLTEAQGQALVEMTVAIEHVNGPTWSGSEREHDNDSL
jgi:hypothetical protein